MTPEDFAADEQWSHLSSELVVARLKVTDLEAEINAKGHGDGRRERLTTARQVVEEAQEALSDRELMLTDPRYGSW